MKTKPIMLSKFLLSAFILFSFACSYSQLKAQNTTDTAANNYDKALTLGEQQAVDKKTDSLGSFLDRIDFHVKTDNLTDFKEGFIPWIELGAPAFDKDMAQLIDKDKVVIKVNIVTVIIDYPLKNECRFGLSSPNGFTRGQLVNAISAKYHEIYKEEEDSGKVKTVPADKRTTVSNRNQTDGKYGIWGHDLSDLALDHILIYQATNGDIVLSLDIDS